MEEKIALIVDASYLVHRNMAIPNVASLKTKTGIRTGGIFGFLKSLDSVTHGIDNLAMIVACFDSYPAYRKMIFPDYKAGRKKNPDSPEYQEWIKEDIYGWSDAKANDFTYDTLKEILPKMKVKVVIQENVEGDDAVYRSSKYLSTLGYKCMVMSDDRDFLQIVHEVPNGCVNRIMAKEIVDSDNFREITGVSPSWFIIAKAMTGDGSDGIPGVANGLGGSTVNQIINKCEELGLDPDSDDIADQILNVIQNWTDKNKARVQKFDFDSKMKLELNLKLMDFRKCPYSEASEEELKSILNEKLEFDNMFLLSKFKEFEFSSLSNILTDTTFRKLS